MTEYANPSAELRARVALEKHRFHNTHSLGQNFLLSESLLEHLLDEAALAPEDCVLEIRTAWARISCCRKASSNTCWTRRRWPRRIACWRLVQAQA